MRSRRLVVSTVLACFLAAGLAGQPASTGGVHSITQEPLTEWLTYLASDELQGRATYSEGLGLAAAYIADHLRQGGVKPAGDNGTYFQTVRVLGVRTRSRASVTVEVGGRTRTFKDGEGVTFQRNMGGRQTVVTDGVQFVGYGVSIPSANHDDYAAVDAAGKAIVFLGPTGPKAIGPESRRLLSGRARFAVEHGAIATIGPAMFGGTGPGGRGAPPPDAQGGQTAGARTAQPAGRGSTGGRGVPDDGDFRTAQRLDHLVPPAVTAQDEFFDFLFSASDVTYAQLKEQAARQEPLPPFALNGVKLTFIVDADYDVVRTRLTRNVVGIVEGTDPELKDTYVVYGAHYDHIGYLEGVAGAGGRCPGDPDDRIHNGADDDGSGTVAIMAIARAFATGPKPKRSLLFVWHAGEEIGLLGSRYNADYPVVPLESMVAQLNMDMVGRNKDDDPARADSVFIVGSDRISTELHNINEDANSAIPRPLTLDYSMNDPADPESIYTRSDHYSYASRGIPIIFYFTGLHPDYHCPSDTVDKIIFDKTVRIAQLAYETGRRVANLDRMPVRDNLGPRVGRTLSGKIATEGSR